MAKFQRIKLDDLFVDDRYQRELGQRRVTRMAENFDEAKLGVLEVSKRKNDRFAIFDGQHRFAVLDMVGATTAPCLVHEGLTPKDEAVLFVSIQTDRKRPRAIEEFTAKLFAGEPEETGMQEIFDKHGIEVGWYYTGDPSEGLRLAAVSSARRMYL